MSKKDVFLLKLVSFFVLYISCYCQSEQISSVRKDYNLSIKVGMNKTEIVNSYGEYELFNRIVADVSIPGTVYPPGADSFDPAEWLVLSNEKNVLFHKGKFIIVLLLKNKAYEIILAKPSSEEVYGVKIGDNRKVVEDYLGTPYQELKGTGDINKVDKPESKGMWLCYKVDNQIISFFANYNGIIEAIKISLPFEEIKEMLNTYYKADIDCIRNQLPGKNKDITKVSAPSDKSTITEMNYADIITLDNGHEVSGEIVKYDDCNFRMQAKTGGICWYSFRVIRDVKSDDNWKVEKFREYQGKQKTISQLPKVNIDKEGVQNKKNVEQKPNNKKYKDVEEKKAYSNRRADRSPERSIEKKVPTNKIEENPYIDGLCYYNKHEYEKAIIEFRKAIEGGINSFLSYQHLGNSLYKTGKYFEAVDAYMKSSRDSPEFHYCLGEVYYDKGDYQNAEKEWRLAMILRTNNSLTSDTSINENALKRIVEYYNKIGEVDKAVKLLEEKYQLGLGISRTNLDILNKKFNDMEMSLKTRDYKSARKHIDEALDIAPNYYLVHFNLAYYYYATNDTQDAEKELEITYKLNPEFTRAYLLYAIIFAEKGEIYKALDKIKMAKDIDPNDPMIYYYSGEIYSLVEDKSNALGNYKKYLGLASGLDFSTRRSVEEKIKKIETGS